MDRCATSLRVVANKNNEGKRKYADILLLSSISEFGSENRQSPIEGHISKNNIPIKK